MQWDRRGRIEELKLIADLVEAAGYLDSRVAIDLSVVRGLEYYTGPVFEVELLLETKDEKGRPVRFGSVGGGGRYDGLVSRFRGEPVPATGFSIGVSRLQAALAMLGKLDTRPAFGPVVVTVFDRDRIADYQKMVATLRNANIRAELYLGNPGTWATSSNMPTGATAPASSSREPMKRRAARCSSRIWGARRRRHCPNQEREIRPAQFSCREDEARQGARSAGRHEVQRG